MTQALTFLILTDTHFVPPGGRLYGLDPQARLQAAIDCINRDHPELDFVIITGDLAHLGEPEAYRSLSETLAGLQVPVILLLGNHDSRPDFIEAFPEAPRDRDGFLQLVRSYPAATVITLDTLDEETRGGHGVLCERRRDFLAQALRGAPTDRPVLLFQHHPPFDTGMPHMDRIKLVNGPDLHAVFETTGRKPDYLFMGHLHRPISGTWQGIPFQVLRSLNHQVAFDLDRADHIPGTHEAPDYALVRVRDGQVLVHQRSFLYEGPLYSLQDPEAVAARAPEELAAQ